MKTIKINQQELRELLSHIQGSTAASIITSTEKRIPGIGDVIKNSHLSIMIGIQFESSMNRSLAKDGFVPDFSVGFRKWGHRIPHTPLVEYKSNYYLEGRVLRDLGHVLRNLNGQIINAKDKPSDERVCLRDFKLSSLKQIRLFGNKYEIIS